MRLLRVLVLTVHYCFKLFLSSLIKACEIVSQCHKKFANIVYFQDDYKHHGNALPAKSAKPAERPLISTVPFADETTQRADFTPKSPLVVEAFKPKEDYKFNNTPFDDLTIFRRDFPAHMGVKKEQSYKPKNVYSPSGKHASGCM